MPVWMDHQQRHLVLDGDHRLLHIQVCASASVVPRTPFCDAAPDFIHQCGTDHTPL